MRLIIGFVVILFGANAVAQEPQAAPKPGTADTTQTLSALQPASTGAPPSEAENPKSAEKTWDLGMVQVPWTDATGGGGVDLLTPFTERARRTEVSLGFGGQFGFEFFLNRRTSYFIEIGGRGRFGGVDTSVTGKPAAVGATVMAGIMLYAF